MVQPEGEPGDGDGHGAGDVHSHYEERQLAGEHEVHLETGVLACTGEGVDFFKYQSTSSMSSNLRNVYFIRLHQSLKVKRYLNKLLERKSKGKFYDKFDI